MPSFLALVRGSNFEIADTPEHGRLGFFTAREVVASDEAAVELAAVGVLQTDPDLRDRTANPPEDPPLLFVEEVVPLTPDLRPSRQGFTFYPDGDPRSEERAWSRLRSGRAG